MEKLIDYIVYFSFTVFGGFMGYFIRTLIDHRLALDRIKENIRITEFNKAAAIFRVEFVATMLFLRKNINSIDKNIISNAEIISDATIIAQEKAKILFEFYLSINERGCFNRAWEDYRYGKDGYESKPGTALCHKEFSQYYLEKINTLLEYAKPK
jgi:hypothetical protein